MTSLYGELTRRFPGIAIRTFLNEYLPALEYRDEIVLSVEATGYFAYNPDVYNDGQQKAMLKEIKKQ